uniref:C2H2-type domain-containing protein n=1 Tax=viral metagenome TaxID=1070528 RepID=A0A6C0JP61_9ZZZZ
MNFFNCKYCNFNTPLLFNYKRHLETVRHKNMEEKLKIKVKLPSEQLICSYCDKTYKHKSSLSKHIKYSCNKNKDEDFKELARLLNLQTQHQQEQDLKHKELEKQFKKMQKENKNIQIQKLTNKLQINGGIHIQNNIQLLGYKETDVSHLTDKDYISCLKKINYCVKNLIERIHFNPLKPENMNIYISNLKDKYMMVYEEGNWNIKTKTELDTLYEEKEIMLEEWIQEDRYPELKEKFIRYLNNKENDETLNMIKDEIKLMMYNKKNMIELIKA